MPRVVKKKAKPGRQNRQAEIQELMSAESQRKAERGLQKFVMELDERSEERMAWVDQILAVNDAEISNVLAIMVETLARMQGSPKIVYHGRAYNAIKGEAELLERIQDRNLSWVAMRCLVACAEWDIQVANFKLPNDSCARCGKSTRKPRKKT